MRNLAGALALVWVLALPTLASAIPVPIPPGAAGTKAAFASPHEAAFDAVDRLIGKDHLIPDQAGGTTFFTRDQMLGVLVELRRAALFPSQSSAAVTEARRLWESAETSYHKTDKFYDVTLTTASVCVQMEANAWALLAADRLANATGDAGLRSRATDLGQTLASVVTVGAAQDTPRCPAGAPVPASQWPLPLYALLRRYESEPSATGLRSAALSQLDREIQDRFRNGGFQDPTNLYLAGTNAQYLLVLQSAERAAPGAYASRRDELNRFIAERLVTLGESPAVRTLQSDARTPIASIEPEAQLWGAVALHQQRSQLPSDRTDLPERLIDALIARSWSTVAGGLTFESGRLSASYNLLATLFTSGPAVTQATAEGARVSVVVPAATSFTYPDPTTKGAERLLISNEWTFRFSLEPFGPSTQSILLPAARLGPIRHVGTVSPFAPAPQLQRAGLAVPVESQGEGRPLLRFTATVQPAAPFRLVDYAPILPTSSDLSRQVRVYFTVNASEPIPVDLLRLDVAMRNVTVESVRFNDALLPSSSYDATAVSATDFLPASHVRLELRDLRARNDNLNEVLITYADAERPTVGAPRFTSDLDGNSPLSRDAASNVYKVSTRSRGYVFVDVQDNAALRTVAAILGQGSNVTEVRLERVPGTDHSYRARLPAIDSRRPVQVQVRAVDEHDLLSESDRFEVQAQPPFLQVGSPVLLVFSATLLVAAFGVWLKMGRKRRR